MEDNKENVEPETKPKFNVKEYMRDYHKKLYNSNPDVAKQKRNFYTYKSRKFLERNCSLATTSSTASTKSLIFNTLSF